MDKLAEGGQIEYRGRAFKQSAKWIACTIGGLKVGEGVSRMGFPAAGVLVMLGCVLPAILAVKQVVFRDRLLLARDGLTLTQKGTETRIAWSDIEAVASTVIVKLWLRNGRTVEIENTFFPEAEALVQVLVRRCQAAGVVVDHDEFLELEPKAGEGGAKAIFLPLLGVAVMIGLLLLSASSRLDGSR